ncbi:hypothetical protein ACFQY4_01945 [Catellatospora bangladeshensis]|uniref:hypothetical protein n=1 Tax=Catellatospora bangladeshensis TaxID=310355 RepID=UPI0036211BAF
MRSRRRRATPARLTAQRAGTLSRRPLPGWLRSLLVLGVGVAAALTLAAPGNAQTPPDVAATHTIQTLTSGDLAAVPADFPRVMGYAPAPRTWPTARYA